MRDALRRNFFRLMLCLLIVGALAWPVSVQADQAQYFYDELGRLVGVVDGNGDVAVYTYDEVGNLLSIDRSGTGGTGIGIFLLAPNRAVVGTEVEIAGFGFSATPTENQVAFNGTAATVVSATPAKLIVTVPDGATTGPVTVTNANGTATSPRDFVVLVPPIIVGIEPDAFPQGATLRAVIGGFNLADATDVTFSHSGISGAIIQGNTDPSNLPITVTVGGAVPAGSYAFSVTTPAGVAESGEVTITVTPAVPSFALGKVSVFMPPTGAPSGSSFSVTPPVSVANP